MGSDGEEKAVPAVTDVGGWRRELARRPDDVDAMIGLGTALARGNKLPPIQEGVSILERARDRAPADARVRLALGEAYFACWQRVPAERELREAVRLRPDWPDGHRALGRFLSRQARHAEAVAEYLEARRLGDRSAELSLELGNSEMQLGHRGRARAAYAEGLLEEPSNAELHSQMGVLKKMGGDEDGAVASLARSVELEPGRADELALLAGWGQGTSFARFGRRLLDRVLALNPRHARSLKARGGYELREGSSRAAAVTLERAAALDPGDAETHALLAEAYRNLGRDAEADREIRRARGLGWQEESR